MATYKEKYWYDIDKKEHLIATMETSYIENVIKFLKKRPYHYDMGGGLYGIDDEPWYEDNHHLVNSKIKELEEELEIRRFKNDI